MPDHAPDVWQLIILWFAVQLLQTLQLWLLGRKVTRTIMPPPFVQVRQSLPNGQPALYRTCRSCGNLRHVDQLEDGMCESCREPTQPTQPARPRRIR